MRDIHVFLSFANFYEGFIKGFSKIVRLFPSMLRTNSTTQLAKNLSLNIAEDAEIGISSNYAETVERSLSISKNLNRARINLNSDA